MNDFKGKLELLNDIQDAQNILNKQDVASAIEFIKKQNIKTLR